MTDPIVTTPYLGVHVVQRKHLRITPPPPTKTLFLGQVRDTEIFYYAIYCLLTIYY
jgi:hypothetical protein